MNWLLAFLILLAAPRLEAAGARLAEEGRALMPIVTAPDAPPEVVSLAHELAAGLNRITGGTFIVERGGGKSGIFVGTAESWPGLLPEPAQDPLLAREDYLLRTEPGRMLLVGRTPLAVQNAVWDFLYRLGFRQYLPGPKWELWPHTPTLEVELDTVERPDYSTRRLRVGTVTWPANRPLVEEWKRRNRLESGFKLSSGHVYGRIIQQSAGILTEGSWTGTEREPKLDASRPEVLEAVEQYVYQVMKANPERDSISMEPSDGGGWPESSPVGSPSDQAVVLANHAARVLRGVAPGRKVGIYAYHMHSPPPNVEVDKDVVVGVATSFIKGGYTAESLMEKWAAKGASIGVREYLGVSAWDYGLPGRARAADPGYIARTIPRFHQLGARYWDSEVTEAWGVHGLGHFLAARYLWDTGEAARHDALLEEFYNRSFGKAAAPMRQLFESGLLKSGNPLLSEDLLGRMYRLLEEALAAEPDPEATARILDFVLYTRYVELMFRFQNSGRTENEAAFREVLRLVEGNHGSMMFDRWLLFREIPGRQFRRAKKEIGPWLQPTLEQARPLDPGELRQFAREGAEKYPPLPFESIAFSADLRPAPFGEGHEGKPPVFTLRGINRLYLYQKDEVKPPFEFSVETGVVYRNRGPVELSLFSDQHPVLDEPVATVSLPPDGALHEVRLASPYSGNHSLEIRDGSGGVRIGWPEGQRGVFPVSANEGTTFHGTGTFYFFVPEGTKVVGGYSANRSGQLVNSSGRMVYDFSQMEGPGYFAAEAGAGEGGQWWALRGMKGRKLLLTVPPYLARSPGELLIPHEINP